MDKIFNFTVNKNNNNNNIILEIEEMCKSGIPLSMEAVDILLENLSYIVRKKIADYEGVDINDFSFYYKCDLAQSIIYYYLNSIGINANPINTNEVISGVIGHSFVIASLNTVLGEKLFLIDPTYIQFFNKDNCNINKFVIIKNQVCITPDPGFFIVENHAEETIKHLLENGYTELTEEVAKAYGDSFFQTKQGTNYNQIKNNTASGLNYIKWFNSCTANLSKNEDELCNMGLLISSMVLQKDNKKNI